MRKSKTFLQNARPDLAKEWDYSKNGKLTPDNVTVGSKKLVWWKCSKEKDHSWRSQVYVRSKMNAGCPFCSGNKCCRSNSLGITNPELAKEWHPTKNGSLTPYDIQAGSNKSVWWKCDKSEDHIWQARPIDRKDDSGCPCCYGRKVVNSNCLETKEPNIAKQWHYELNVGVTPKEIYYLTRKSYWWKCSNGEDHIWRNSPKTRINQNQGCPFCSGRKPSKDNCLEQANPLVCEEWDYKKNDKTPKDYTPKSDQKVWWICKECQNSWKTSIKNRANGSSCTKCKGFKGEKRIRAFLDSNHINYSREYSFPDCKNERSLRFDFCINIDNAIYLIEYQGEQHFGPIRFNGITENKAKKVFENVTKRDNIKREYCKTNGIYLLEIPYTEFDNIEQILSDLLNWINTASTERNITS